MSVTYVLHDWSRKFRIEVNDTFSIFPEFDSSEQEIYSATTLPLYSFSMEGKRILPTEDPGLDDHDFEPDNTTLVDMGDGSYLFVGGSYIYSFRPTEPIKHFYSPIGNSGTAYPWAVSNNFTYLLIEKAVIPTSLIFFRDPYSFYYCFDRHGEIRLDAFSEMKLRYRTLVPIASFYVFSQSYTPIIAYTPSGEKVSFQMTRDVVGDLVIPSSYLKGIDSGELLTSPPE